MRVLAAGDEFVRTDLLTAALRAELGTVDVRPLDLPWPSVPWSSDGEVEEYAGDADTVIAALDGAAAAVTHLAPFTAKVFDACPELRLVVVSRGGPVNVDLDAATEAGVPVCFAPGRNAAAAAEFTVGLLLAACRHITTSSHAVGNGAWSEHYFRYDAAGLEIEGVRVGLVGYGAIGRRVARVLLTMGATIGVYDPYVGELDPGIERIERLERLDDLLATSQVVSLHARATAENRGLIGTEQLAQLPTGAVLVNTARPGLLDYDALCDALDSGRLAAAGLDVFPEEPLPPDHRLLRTRGVVATPHLAGCSRAVAEKAARICAAEVGRWARGEPLANVANPAVLDHHR